MGSTRLPGKVLMPLVDKPILAWVLERVKRAKSIDECIVATTKNSADDAIVALCSSPAVAVSCIRGDEEDVLERYFQAASAYRADTIVRITADCPLIDPEVLDDVVNFYNDNFPLYDYVSNSLKHTFPRGLDVEVFSMESLKIAKNEATEAQEREHVTLFLYRHPERFHLGNVAAAKDLSSLRWTVDTEEDFELVRRLTTAALSEGKPNFTMKDLLAIDAAHPIWRTLNAHIQQKSITPPQAEIRKDIPKA